MSEPTVHESLRSQPATMDVLSTDEHGTVFRVRL